ncbi:MAG: protein kinase [Eubacteriales bacterium]|nr:protein kinase [Eubacteriales bacterium]
MENHQMELPWKEWQIIRQLGEGSFGKVYEVAKKNAGFVSHAAVKVMKIPAQKQEIYELQANGMTDQEINEHYQKAAQKLNNEIMLMDQLKSAANIVSIHDSAIVKRNDTIGYYLFIRMELLKDLDAYCYSVKKGSISVEEVIKVGCDICNALSACEKKNIIHRDIKPSNIFVSEYGDFKLGDFGVSRHKEHPPTHMSMQGTNNYMAPEVFRNDGNYNNTVDIYALGLVLYRLLNYGKIPFVSQTRTIPSADEVADAQTKRLAGKTLPDPVLGGPELVGIIRKACSYNPEERFQTAREMRDALLKCKFNMSAEELEQTINRKFTPEKRVPQEEATVFSGKSAQKPVQPPVQSEAQKSVQTSMYNTAQTSVQPPMYNTAQTPPQPPVQSTTQKSVQPPKYNTAQTPVQNAEESAKKKDIGFIVLSLIFTVTIIVGAIVGAKVAQKMMAQNADEAAVESESSDISSSDAETGESGEKEDVWICTQSLDTPDGYQGGPVRLQLIQKNGDTQEASMIVDGKVLEFPYQLDIKGISGVSEGTLYISELVNGAYQELGTYLLKFEKVE